MYILNILAFVIAFLVLEFLRYLIQWPPATALQRSKIYYSIQ